jgi:hypothetical protein
MSALQVLCVQNRAMLPCPVLGTLLSARLHAFEAWPTEQHSDSSEGWDPR